MKTNARWIAPTLVGGMAALGAVAGYLVGNVPVTEASGYVTTEQTLLGLFDGRDTSDGYDAAMDAWESEIASQIADTDAYKLEVDAREAAITADEALLDTKTYVDDVLWEDVIVGQDIPQGRYVMQEPVSSSLCRWSVNEDDIMQSIGGRVLLGQASIHLYDGDVFRSENCGGWVLVD